MLVKETERLYNKGLEALVNDDTLSALAYFEKALKLEATPSICSYFAFCIAKERGQSSKAISLCEESIKKEPDNSAHYLNLGSIYLLIDKRADAINIFREGLKYELNPQIVDELNRIGTRKPPVIPFLKRNNPLNKYLGIILELLRLR